MFQQIVYAVQDCALADLSSIPHIQQLREKYTYNVCPCALPEDEEAELHRHDNSRPCPPPSRGGCFGPPLSHKVKGDDGSGRSTAKKFRFRGKKKEFVEDQLSSSVLPGVTDHQPMKEQVKLLQEHYSATARQPSLIRCYLDLTPPKAKAVCPQTKKTFASSELSQLPMYGIDVPEEVVAKSHQLSGYESLQELKKHKRVFTISYTHPDPSGEFEGIELGPNESNRTRGGGGGGGMVAEAPGVGKAKSYSAERDLLLRYASGRHLPW